MMNKEWKFSNRRANRIARGLEWDPFVPDDFGDGFTPGRLNNTDPSSPSREMDDILTMFDDEISEAESPPAATSPHDEVAIADLSVPDEASVAVPGTPKAQPQIDPRLDRLTRKQMQCGVLARGTDYVAFKDVPQVRRMLVFAKTAMKTDGQGNVLRMPWLRVPKCFGDIISITMWRKTLPLGRMPSLTRPGTEADILSRCTRCKVQNACDALRMERINSDPNLRAEFDAIQDFRGPGWEKIHLIKEFARSVSWAWRWYTMDRERRQFAREQVEDRRLEKNRKASDAYAAKKAAMTKPDPLSFQTPALRAERKSKLDRAASMIVSKPSDRHLRYLTVEDAARITATWYARELVIAASYKPSAGRVAKILIELRTATNEGEALRKRVSQDFKFIERFETPGGCWA